MKPARLAEERRDEKLPAVPLPGEKEIERRKTLSSYGREMRNRIRHINTLHAIFVHQGHATVAGKNLAAAEKRREAARLLTGLERGEAEWIVKYLELHGRRIKELKGKMQKEAKKDGGMRNLQTIPGVGPVAASGFSPLHLRPMQAAAAGSARGRRRAIISGLSPGWIIPGLSSGTGLLRNTGTGICGACRFRPRGRWSGVKKKVH